MALYVQPTGAQIRRWTRLDGAAFGIENPQLEADLFADVQHGEDMVFASVGEDLLTDATLGAARARLLARAVAHATAGSWLWEIWQDVIAGTYEPLLSADADAIKALIDANNEAAEKLASGEPAGSGLASIPAYLITSTFLPGAMTVRPSQRLASGDERDDLPQGWDLPAEAVP